MPPVIARPDADRKPPADKRPRSPIAPLSPEERYFRSMPDPMSLPSEPSAREVAILFADHPYLAEQFGKPDLKSLSPGDARSLLAEVRAELGIKPFSRRDLGYMPD